MGFLPPGDQDGGIGITVMAGVAEKVVKDPGQLVGIAGIGQLRRQVQHAAQVPLRQLGLKLAANLFQHPAEVRGALLQLQMRQAEAGDIKELVHQIFQPFGLVQGNANVAGLQFR